MNCKLFESTDFYVPKIIRIIAAEKERMKKMTTITLDYDEKNTVIRKLIEAILDLGAKERISELDQAIKEVESGDTIKCDGFEDYLAKMNEPC